MKLFIVDSRRRKKELEVPGDDTLLDLKKRLEEQSNIPTQCQFVAVRKGRKELLSLTKVDDNKTLKDIDLKDDDILEYEPFRVHIQHVNWNEGQTVTLDLGIHPDTCVKELKDMVEQKTNIPAYEQRVVFFGMFLDDPHDTIGSNGVEHDDTIEIHDGLTVSVVHKPTGMLLFEQAAEPTDTIHLMKHHIQQTSHVLVDEQKVFWKGKKLTEDDATLRETGILHGDTLEFDNDVEEMEVQIRLATSEIFTIQNINFVTNTVDNLKLRVQEIEGIPKDIQYLDFMGTNLTDPNKSLMECHIYKKGDMIDLTPHRVKLTPVEEMVLTIRLQKGPDRGDGETDSEVLCELTVLPKDTIRDVKKRIQDKTKILMFLQQLSHDGKLLSDDRPTLHYLGIKTKETLDLVKLPQEVKVKIIHPKGEEFLNETIVITHLDRMDKLIYVQQKLEKKQGTKVENQDLWYHGKRLTQYGDEDEDKQDRSHDTLFDLRIKHNAVLELKIPAKEAKPKKPKKKKKIKPRELSPAPPQKEDEQTYDHGGMRYKMNRGDYDWCRINKARKNDYIGLTFKKEGDGNYYVDTIDPEGWALTFAPYLKEKALVMKFGDKEPADITVDYMHNALKDEMVVELTTTNPKAIVDNSKFDYGDDFGVGDVVNIDGGPVQGEIRRQATKGKWMLKNLDTGKVMLVAGTQLTKA
mmetsp:Transcript_17165/g.41777  ORF Transcript_17165/g.41777 Transcript_17165/m.41777 type:complete len:690 (+) Transcript_17165:58-2127(+)